VSVGVEVLELRSIPEIGVNVGHVVESTSQGKGLITLVKRVKENDPWVNVLSLLGSSEYFVFVEKVIDD
jgi:hypothetical protein